MLTFVAMSFIMIVRYFALSSLFVFLLKDKNLNPVSRELIRKDQKYSVISSFIFAFFGALIIELWKTGETAIYTDLSSSDLFYIPLSLIVYLFIHDTYFYWTHRLLHKKALMKFHIVHHYSKIPTAWTSFSFHPVEALIQAIIIPVLIFIIPIHVGALAFVLMMMTFFGLTNHLGYEIFPAWLEKRLFMITATHHQKHHDNLKRNYGLYFTVWDHLMTTEDKT